jgi:hypothetical protein
MILVVRIDKVWRSFRYTSVELHIFLHVGKALACAIDVFESGGIDERETIGTSADDGAVVAFVQGGDVGGARAFGKMVGVGECACGQKRGPGKERRGCR